MIQFIQWATTGNVWGFFHALAGGVLFVVGIRIVKLKPYQAMLAVLASAVIWECFEYLKDGPDMTLIYGSWPRYYADSAGDVVLALINAGIVWYALGNENLWRKE